jgi:hypothetical protein
MRWMRWLLDSNLDPAVAPALVRHEQKVCDVASLVLPATDPATLLAAATKEQLELITANSAVVDFCFDEKIWFRHVIVYLQLVGGDVEQDDAIDRLFKRYKRLTPGRLYTVTANRVKVRQLPARQPA